MNGRSFLADRPELSWRLNVAADRTRQTITALNTAPFLTGPSYAGSTSVTQIFQIAPGETFGVMYGTKIVHSIDQLYDDPAKSPACPGTWCPDSRWQTYFRASGAYRLSQDFHIKGIDEFKLRASYGTAGLRPSFAAQYETFAFVGSALKKVTLGNNLLKPAIKFIAPAQTTCNYLSLAFRNLRFTPHNVGLWL